MPKLSALKYYGGKNANSGAGSGRWIAEMLPWNKQQTYIEPFAGMLGGLLQRAPTAIEIANDLNGDIVHWWLTVRDHGKEFAQKLRYTPHSREVYERAVEDLAEGGVERIARALAIHIVLSQSLSKGGWSARYVNGGRRDGASYASMVYGIGLPLWSLSGAVPWKSLIAHAHLSMSCSTWTHRTKDRI